MSRPGIQVIKRQGMKLGVLGYKPGFAYLEQHRYNIGDNIQSIAVRELYRSMGIGDSQIVEVNKYGLNSYDGEYVILPMANFCALKTPGMFPLSPKIIPVYIGFHLADRSITQEYVDHFKQHEPIGCRDEYTLENLRSQGVVAYLSGCVTATLPQRDQTRKYEKVFFVDTPEKLQQFIPSSVLGKAEFLSHVDYYKKIPLDDGELRRISEIASERLKKYRDEAALVVTSRLHCASPCIAMGIPVVFAHNLYHYTFWAVDKFVKVYMPDSFSCINWNPTIVDYEPIKLEMIDLFTKKIQSSMDRHRSLVLVSEFYEQNDSDRGDNGYIKFVERFKGRKNFKCALWGANIHATAIMDCLPKVFEDYEIVDVIDEFKKGKYNGFSLRKSLCVKEHDPDVVYFVTAHPAFKQAEKLFKELNRTFVLVA